MSDLFDAIEGKGKPKITDLLPEMHQTDNNGTDFRPTRFFKAYAYSDELGFEQTEIQATNPATAYQRAASFFMDADRCLIVVK